MKFNFYKYLIKLVPVLIILCSTNSFSQQAKKATGGTGLYKDRIWWLNFEGVSLAAGGTQTKIFTIGTATVTVIIDQIAFSGQKYTGSTDLSDVRLEGYNSSFTFGPTLNNDGDGLDQLYNIGGTESNNQLYYALTNNINGAGNGTGVGLTATFRMRAYINGLNTPLSLIFASAESDSYFQDNSALPAEYTKSTTNGSPWQLLEKKVQSSNSLALQRIDFSNSNLTAKMNMGAYFSPGNVALLYTTKASVSSSAPLTVNTEMLCGGKSAVAIGLIIDQDGGDAPATFGSAIHSFQPNLSGGNPTAATHYLSRTPILAAGTLTVPNNLYLGTVPADNDATIFTSANSDADDNNGIDDEDAFNTNPVVLAGCQNSYTLSVPVHNSTNAPAYLRGWIDFNGNGTFQTTESVSTTVASGATSATLNWTGVTPITTTGFRTMRLRISSNDLTASDNSTTVFYGEVEDHRIQFVVAQTPTIGTITHASCTVPTGSFTITNYNPSLTYTFLPSAGITLDTATGQVTANPGTYTIQVASGTCTASLNVQINTTSSAVSGTAAANQSISAGTAPSPLTLTGSTGVIQWQVSSDNITFNNISSATGTSYSPGNLYQTTYYRALVTNGGCSASSNVVTITVTACSAGNAAPSFTNTVAYTNNSGFYQVPCGSTTVNLSTLLATNQPANTTVTWHTSSIATDANKLTSAQVSNVMGTSKYYAAFYNASGGCYSPTKMITVIAPICAVDDDYTATPIVAGVGGTLPSIFGNDTYNGIIISTMPANSVDFNYELWPNLGVTVDGNGILTIPASLAPGTYTQNIYSICDKDNDIAASSNCSSAEVKFTVVAAPFGCSTNMYLSQGSTLYTIGTGANPFTYPTVGIASVSYNGIGLNPLDGKIYGMQANSNNLITINSDGTSTVLGVVTGLPTTTPVLTYFSGEVDSAGNYYIMPNITGGSNRLYKVNLTTRVATLITLSRNVYMPDIAYSVTTGLFYGVDNATSTGQFATINASTGLVTNIGTGPGTANFGAMYTSSTGEVYGARNDGGFYQFNLITGERVLISSAPASTANDGAHCVTAPITFSADLSVTKTDGVVNYTPGTTNTYTVTVTNNGPFGVLNAKVSDPVPAGIPSANVSYTAVSSAGSTTTVSGTQIGAINDLVGLPVGGTVTYTILINIPTSFTGSLTNTVTVTPPANISDANMTNNSATDTDTSGVCYKPGIAGTGLPVNHGISSLGRAGADNGNWPMVRQSAWTALEAKTKGFVVNRLTTAQISAIPAANVVEGMMVYNVTLSCLQINTNGTPTGWACLNSQTCPPN